MSPKSYCTILTIFLIKTTPHSYFLGPESIPKESPDTLPEISSLMGEFYTAIAVLINNLEVAVDFNHSCVASGVVIRMSLVLNGNGGLTMVFSGNRIFLAMPLLMGSSMESSDILSLNLLYNGGESPVKPVKVKDGYCIHVHIRLSHHGSQTIPLSLGSMEELLRYVLAPCK